MRISDVIGIRHAKPILISVLISVIAGFLSAFIVSTGKFHSPSSPPFSLAHSNELGAIPILRYTISSPPQAHLPYLLDDLLTLHRHHFRQVRLEDIYGNHPIDLPAGARPYAIVFSGQVSHLISQPGSPNSRDCITVHEMLQKFSRQYHAPVYPTAILTLATDPISSQNRSLIESLNTHGWHLASSSINNLNLPSPNISEMIRRDKRFAQELNPTGNLSGFFIDSTSTVLKPSAYKAFREDPSAALFVPRTEPAVPRYHIDFDRYTIPTIQMPESSSARHQVIDSILDQPSAYVSDGDPNIVTLPLSLRGQLYPYWIEPGRIVRIIDPQTGATTENRVVSKIDAMAKKQTAHRGLYLTFYTASNTDRLSQIKTSMLKSGLDTLVLNVKDERGHIGIPLSNALAKEIKSITSYIPDPKALIRDFHQSHIKVSARIVVFLDFQLAKRRPDLAIGDPVLAREWADPFNPTVWDYNIDIAEEAARLGVDEIQFDYIRFPPESSVTGPTPRYTAIENFLKAAFTRLNPYGVSLAADVFGITAWEDNVDILRLGQRLPEMAKYLDVICPMIYPSHFHSNFDGYSNPADHPYRFIDESCDRIQSVLSGIPIKIVPWIQGFDLYVTQFGPPYILKQRQALLDNKIEGYLVWNASNNYTTTFLALQ